MSNLLIGALMRPTRLVLSCVFVLATALAAAAQGLGALAAETEAQRRARRGSGAPVFSNDTLPSQSRLEAALRDVELSFDLLNRVGDVQSALFTSRQRSPKLHAYLASFDNIGATRPPMAEQANEFSEIYDALDRGRFTPFAYDVAMFAIEQAVVDATRSDAELKTFDPARQSRAAFARKWAQTFANGRWADAQRAKQLPPPRPQ